MYQNLDNPNILQLANEVIDLPDYDHTIVAKFHIFSEPLLVVQGIAESYQLNDLTFIIKPDPLNELHFEKIRVKASVETSFHVIRGCCDGLGVYGRYKIEKYAHPTYC